MTYPQFRLKARDFASRLGEFLRKNPNLDMSCNFEEIAVNGCGDCTHCCVLPSISKEQYATGKLPPTPYKPMGDVCRYCTGEGCGVYDARPEVCKGYLCLYRFGLTDRLPKDSGIAWTYEPNYETGKSWVVVGHTLSLEGLLESPEFIDEVLQLSQMVVMSLRVSMIVVRTPTKGMAIYPSDGHVWKGRTASVVQNPDGSHTVDPESETRFELHLTLEK